MKRINSRIIDVTSNDELDKFEQLLQAEYEKHNGMDKTHEDWLDSEFNKILVTYVYPDLTNPQ